MPTEEKSQQMILMINENLVYWSDGFHQKTDIL